MCPVAQVLPELVKRRALGVEGIEEVEVNLVWEPAWTQERISPEGRKELGMDEPAG
jgi:metal-sulfur cluster biosynthetic enzyme